MRRTILITAALLAAAGCGDETRSGSGDTGSTGGNGGAGSGVFATGQGAGGSSATTVGPAVGSGGGAATTGSGDPGISCSQIWDCYSNCQDTNCTAACYDQGSDVAQTADKALWRCLFSNNCDWQCAFQHSCDSDPCVQQNCGPESQTCFGG